MNPNTTDKVDPPAGREFRVSVACDRTSRRCDLTVVWGNGGYADLIDATPREVVERIAELQANPANNIAPIRSGDLHAIVRPLAKKRGVLATPSELASYDDALWFRLNPRAVHRTRPIMPGEMGVTADDSQHVIVTQISPGLRIRRFGHVRDQVQ